MSLIYYVNRRPRTLSNTTEPNLPTHSLTPPSPLSLSPVLQVDSDRQHYEEKLRSLQSQFESGDARSHIEALEEELRTAKEVSVRLHDELDLMEDRRNKAMEENRHLSDLLEQTDKKQFRMEMEIDKLRDQVGPVVV